MSARVGSFGLAVAAAAALFATGCADEIVRGGSIAHAPVVLPAVPHSSVPLGIAAPRDERPEVEHQGDADHTKLFFTIAVVTHWEKAGNYVTGDLAATTDASGELATVLANTIQASKAAVVVPPGTGPAYVLETTIEHLYATHYAANEGTVVVIPARQAPGGGANVQGRVYADYGNVVIHARLVDQHAQPPRVVWDEIVTGSGEAPAGKEKGLSAQRALNLAVADAAVTLTVRVSSALERLGTFNHAHAVTDDMPPVFLIERVSRLRDFLQVVTVETGTGRVISNAILALSDRSYGRPGEWLLSRRLPDGTLLGGDDYDAFAKKLAVRYDLRTYDDVSRYHFFGVRGAVP